MVNSMLRIRGTLTALLGGATLFLWASASLALAPTLGSDCGQGAQIIGSDAAGKVVLGHDVATCTLTFTVPWPNAPACAATNETNTGGHATFVGVRTTKTTLVMDPSIPYNKADTISYLCMGY